MTGASPSPSMYRNLSPQQLLTPFTEEIRGVILKMALHGHVIDDDGDNNINNKKYIAKLIMKRSYLRALLSFLQTFLDSSLKRLFFSSALALQNARRRAAARSLRRASPARRNVRWRRPQPSPMLLVSTKYLRVAFFTCRVMNMIRLQLTTEQQLTCRHGTTKLNRCLHIQCVIFCYSILLF